MTNVVSDDEKDTNEPKDGPNAEPDEETIVSEGADDLPVHTSLPQQPRPITFNAISDAPTDEEHQASTTIEDTLSPQQEYLLWHHRLNHLSYNHMNKMIKAGLLPARLAAVRPPNCPACLLGRATRRPWRTKSQVQSLKVPQVTGPGHCISVDQLQSTTPGLIAQLRGFLTKERYHFATVFVDHYSSLSFVYLQKTSNMEETLKAKETFE